MHSNMNIKLVNFILQGCYVAHIGSLVVDISGQPISPIFKDQAVQGDPWRWGRGFSQNFDN
jgi:hypothetical protein